MRSKAYVAILVAYLFATAELRTVQAEDFGSIEGTWEGELSYLNGPGLSVPQDQTAHYRITIRGKRAKAFIWKQGLIAEMKPGEFRLERFQTNVLVFAMDSGQDYDGTWIETLLFAMTQKDRNTLIANFSRVVNNKDLPLSVAYSKFSMIATGELKRASP